MAAEFVAIVGKGILSLTTKQVEKARRELGHAHLVVNASHTLMLFEIGGENDDSAETLANISCNVTGAERDDEFDDDGKAQLQTLVAHKIKGDER